MSFNGLMLDECWRLDGGANKIETTRNMLYKSWNFQNKMLYLELK